MTPGTKQLAHIHSRAREQAESWFCGDGTYAGTSQLPRDMYVLLISREQHDDMRELSHAT